MNIQYSIGSKEPITETKSDQASPNEKPNEYSLAKKPITETVS